MTSSYDVQICSVSDQPDPNFFSVHESQYRPKKLYLIVTKKMKEKAEWLSNAVSGKTEVIPIVIEDENDPSKIRTYFETILKKELQKSSKVLVNITGGTKLMAITASRVCEKLGVPYVYVTLDRPAFLFFTSLDISPEMRELNPNLKDEWVERYLAAHAVKFNRKGEYLRFWEEPTPEQKRFFEFIFGNMKNGESVYRGALVTLIKLKWTSEKNPLARSLIGTRGVSKVEFNLLLDELERLGMIERKDKEFTYKDANTHSFFAKNRWFEMYVASQLMELDMGIRPFTLSFHKTAPQRENDHGLVKNELDVVFFFRGKLHVLEVKSGLAGTQGHGAQSMVYKVNGVSINVGGIGCKRAIVSWYPATPEYNLRAKEQGMTVFSGKDVSDPKGFQERLRAWLR